MKKKNFSIKKVLNTRSEKVKKYNGDTIVERKCKLYWKMQFSIVYAPHHVNQRAQDQKKVWTSRNYPRFYWQRCSSSTAPTRYRR